MLECRNSKTPEPIDDKFGVGDYVGDNFPQAKIQNDRPIEGVAAYAWNITVWLLVFLSFSFLFCDPNVCSCPKTKLHKRFLRRLLHVTLIPISCILEG